MNIKIEVALESQGRVAKASKRAILSRSAEI